MDWVAATGIIFGLLLAFLVLGMPVAFAMGLIGFFGYWLVDGLHNALSMLPLTAYYTVTNYNLSPIPLFILMGEVLFYAGVGASLFDSAEKWLGRLPGGLAMAAVVACAFFAAICGSSIATAVTIGIVAIPEMERRGYSTRLATGAVAGSGGLGLIIPPSVGLIILAVLTEESAGKLLVAGVIPGVVIAVLFMMYIGIRVKLQPRLGPSSVSRVSWRDKIFSLRTTWPVIALFLLVIGGIYGGLFTPTEAAAVGAAGSIVLCGATRKLSWRNLARALMDTMRSTAMLFTIFVFAFLYAQLMALLHIPQNLSALIGGFQVSPYVTLGMIVLVLVILGCFMDGVAMVFLTVPVLYPVGIAVGFNPIWFLLIYQIACELGTETPPVGMNLFAIRSVLPHIPLGDIIRGAFPFVFLELAAIVILTIFPQLVLFLPNTMF